MFTPTSPTSRWRRRGIAAAALLMCGWIAIHFADNILCLILSVLLLGIGFSMTIMAGAVVLDVMLGGRSQFTPGAVDTLWRFWFLNLVRLIGLVTFATPRVRRLIATLELHLLSADLRLLRRRTRLTRAPLPRQGPPTRSQLRAPGMAVNASERDRRRSGGREDV